MKNFLKIQIIAIFGVLFLSACSTSNDVVSNNLITKRKHNKGFHIDFRKNYETQKGNDFAAEKTVKTEIEASKNAIETNEKSRSLNENQVSVSKINESTSENPSTIDHLISDENPIELETKESITEEKTGTSFIRAEKTTKKQQKIASKHTFKALKKSFARSNSISDSEILILILCIILPPLAVYLNQGSWNTKCWISLLLTIFFWLPGIVYALYVCFA